jgi:hypothetical protein
MIPEVGLGRPINFSGSYFACTVWTDKIEQLSGKNSQV